MGTTPSKATKQLNNVTNSFAPTKTRLSKRILKRNSAIYPSSTNSKILEVSEKNNNSASAILSAAKEHENNSSSSSHVVMRNKSENEPSKHSNESISDNNNQRASKRDSKMLSSKKKKVDSAASKESVSTYHQTNVCYFKVDDGKFLKLPSDTKHKSSDGCYVKQQNGSFRHINFNTEHENETPKSTKKDTNHHNKSANNDNKDAPNQSQNRKVLVTMIDAGLPVVAISKRDKTSTVKKEKLKVTQNNNKCLVIMNMIRLVVDVYKSNDRKKIHILANFSLIL